MYRSTFLILALALVCGCGGEHTQAPGSDTGKVMLSFQALLNRLDRIRSSHPEVSDTAVRKETFRAVFLGFVEQVPGYTLPDRFGMFSLGTDGEVRSALARFVKDGTSEARARGLDTAEKRFAAFEEITAASNSGTPRFVFFGSAGNYEAARRSFGR